ncbi:MAG: GreA/GreB family elongation factor [Bdellovibrionales bacterium]|nr:GreA/GreB family elongation factor [Bdellovibrionales bacterium]
MTIDKKAVVAAFIEQLEKDLLMMKEAARATYEAATHEESRPENEYDTRGLEASYLAGAQAKRAGEIDQALSFFRTLEFPNFAASDSIKATALVEIELDGKRNVVLMMPKGGGLTLQHGSQHVQIVTPASSLGEALLGLRVGDVAEFEVGAKVRECEVLSIH